LARGAETPRDLNKLRKRPKIMITTEEYKVNRKAAHALRVDPALFQRGNMLVRVLRETATYYDEAGAVQPMDLCRDPGAPRIAPVPPALLREKLTRFARWRSVKVIKGEEVAVPAHPPTWAVDSLMHWGNWDEIRHLESIIETPVLRPDGTLLSAPGYDAATGLLLEPHAEFPAVAEEPTRADAVHAAHMLLDLVGDFPFAGAEHRAAWLAGLLTPLARFAIKGPVPLFVFDANMARVGKTKLVDVISLIATGRKVARSACPATDEEWDKRLLAIAMAGTRLVLFDNLSTGGNLGSPSLDAALTGSSYAGRILGETAWASDIPFTTIMYASGNNLQLIGDITGRVVFTRMESRVDRPEERADFRVPDLLGHVRATRGELAVAALTILRGFVVAGRPAPNPPLPPLGEYAAWSALVRHAVHWATGLDPCATRELARSCDRLAQSLPALLVGWHRLCAAEGKSGLTTSEAIDALTANPQGHAALHAILAEQSRDGKLPPPQKLGNYLGRIRGRVCKGWAIKAKTVHGANSWTVTKIDPAAPDITEIDAEAPAE
jgi:putative DNA primase/helicase